VLQVEIQRGVDGEPAVQHLLTAERLEEGAAHLFGEVGGRGEVAVGLRALHRRDVRQGLLVVVVGDEARVVHLLEHVAAPLLGGVGVRERRVLRRSLGKPRQQGGL
jgi:hypothetical protein